MSTLFSNMPQERLVFVDDLEVWVVERSNRKRVSIHVLPPDGRIEARVPLGTPDFIASELVRSSRSWIERKRKEVASSPMVRAETASTAELKEMRKAVEAFTPGLVAKWEPILGVKAGKLAYRNMKSRWGSCQPATGRICINTRLALYPRECLEYVVVHELCHLRVPGHGQAFHALMDSVLPDWKQRKKKLR